MKGMKKKVLAFVLASIMIIANMMTVHATGSCAHTTTSPQKTGMDSWRGDGLYLEVEQVCDNCKVVTKTEWIRGIGVSIDGYGEEITWMNADEKMVDSSIGHTTIPDGRTVAEHMDFFKYEGLSNETDPSFEGWAKFYWENNENGESVPMFQAKNGTTPYYTMAEIMNDAVTRDVAYAAKWSDIAIEEYYQYYEVVFEKYGECDFSFYCYEPNEQLQEMEWVERSGNGFGYDLLANFEVGSQYDYNYKIVDEPAKKGATFEGWAMFKKELVNDEYTYTFVPKASGEPYYTTQEAFAMKVPVYDVVFATKWSDIPIDDYYVFSNVRFESFDENCVITYSEYVWNDEKQEAEWVEYAGDFGENLKKGFTIKSQFENRVKVEKDPTRAGSKFEGWARFKVDSETNKYTFEPQSSTKQYYTTEEMLDYVVPDYDIAFVPKWNDISIEEYFPNYYAIALDANGGEVVSSETWKDEDGEHKETYYETILTWATYENKSISQSFEKDDYVLHGIYKEGQSIDSWKVYEAEEIYYEFIGANETVPKSDDKQFVVYYDQFVGEDGTKKDAYVVVKGYKLVDNAVSTEKLLNDYKNGNYYAVVNWKDSLKVVEDTSIKESLANEQKAVVDAIVAGTAKETVVSKDTAEKVKAAVEAKKEITAELVVYPVEETLISSKDKADMLNKAATELGTATKVQFLDIQVLLKADKDVLGNINELQKEIEITVAIPENMKVADAKYVVIRNHNGEITVLPVTVNANGTITFKTDKFSTYALAYAGKTETVTRPASPATGDSSMVSGYALVCVAALAVIVLFKKRETYN